MATNSNNPNNYFVRDGTGASIVIKSTYLSDPDFGSIQIPNSIPTDPTGVPYSATNPMPVTSAGGGGSTGNIGSVADQVDANGNGSVIAQARNIWTLLFNVITVKIRGSVTTWTDYSGTITTANTAQDVVSANANRKGFSISNLDLSNFIFINFTGNATGSAGSIPVGPMSTWEMSPHTLSTARISVIGPNAGMVFTAKEAT